MYEIKKAEVGNYEMIKSFLLEVPAITEVEEEILLEVVATTPLTD